MTLQIAELLYEEIRERDFDPVSQVNGYIQAHFTESTVTVDGIARDLNFNTSYLCAVYKKKSGRQSMPRSRKPALSGRVSCLRSLPESCTR